MTFNTSSNIAEANYQDGTLTIRFTNQTVYEYYNVPESVFDGLTSATSAGEYHASFIKGVYSYKRIR